jgi:hypothetical protein
MNDPKCNESKSAGSMSDDLDVARVHGLLLLAGLPHHGMAQSLTAPHAEIGRLQ